MSMIVGEPIRIFGEPERGIQDSLRFDISETPSEYKITVELPGVHPDDLDVAIHGRSLFLRGVRRFEVLEKDEFVLSREISRGTFQRRLDIDGNIDPDRLVASYSNGMLLVRIGKIQDGLNTRRIPVLLS